MHLVGRDDDVRRLTALLTHPTRRIVVFGRPGVGKTAVLDQFSAHDTESEVWRVDLTGTEPGRPLLTDVALRLGLGANPTADRLATAISTARVLLIIDHADATRIDTPELDGLLDRCPALTIVLARRQRLPWPAAIELRALSVPDPDAAWQDVAASSAVELFTANARRIDPGFALTPDSARGVGDVCRLVGGLPFSIGIVAARIGPLGPAALAAFLSAGRTDIDIRALHDSSLRHITTAQRELLQRLACFSGTIPIDAVIAAAPASAVSVIDDLERLVDFGLVEPSRAGDDGFSILPIVRDVVRSDTDRAGDADRAHRDYLDAVLRRAAAAAETGASTDDVSLAVLLGNDLTLEARRRFVDDERSAAPWLIDCAAVLSGTVESSDLLAAFESLLVSPTCNDLDDANRAAVLLWSSALLAFASDGTSLAALIDERWQRGRALVDDDANPVLGMRSYLIGLINGITTGRLVAAAQNAIAGAALAERVGAPIWAARFAAWMAAAAHSTGDPATARIRGLEALERGLRTGDATTIVGATIVLRTLPRGTLTPGDSVPELEDALAMAKSRRQELMESFLLASLTRQELDLGHTRSAARWCAQRLSNVRLRGESYLAAISLVHAAFIAARSGDWVQTATLVGTFQADHGRILRAMAPTSADEYERTVREVRRRLGEHRATQLMTAGSLLSAPAAASSAVRWLSSHAREQPATPTVLTPREHEVVALVASGLANKEIAERLGMAPKTVMHHTVSIYRKLGVRGRAEAAAYAHRTRLVETFPALASDET